MGRIGKGSGTGRDSSKVHGSTGQDFEKNDLLSDR